MKQIEFAKSKEISNPDTSVLIFNKILKSLNGEKPKRYVAYVYQRLAILDYQKTNNFKAYFDYNFKAAKILEEIKDSSNLMSVYQNIGIGLARQLRYQEAKTYYSRVQRYAKTHHNSDLYLSSSMAISDCFSNSKKTDTALVILLELEENFPKDLELYNLGTLYSNIGNTYYNVALDGKNARINYLKVVDYCKKAQNIFLKNKEDESDESFVLGLTAAAYSKLGQFELAEKNYEAAIAIEQRINSITDLSTLYYEMTELQIKMGNKEKALLFFNKNDSVSRIIINDRNSNSLSEMKTQFETEKKEQENKALILKDELSNQTIKQQKYITIIIVIGLFCVSFLAFFIFKGLKKQKHANAIISIQKEEVDKQKHIIEENQKATIDSINYAKRIQYALLAQNSLLKNNIKEHFILFKPKDIVSGDFYWASEYENKFYLAVCDCTGHGVPGAFMSLLSIGFLSEAVKEKHISQPNEILNYVRKRLIESIGSDGQQDGMDAILICLDKASNIITYSAANNEPILISNNQILELPKDKMPVGKGEKLDSFTLHTINATAGDTLYLYTDGYADQFGGEKGKKFKYKPLNDMLLSISVKKLDDQKNSINDVFEKWKGDLEQVDDVCIVGIKI